MNKKILFVTFVLLFAMIAPIAISQAASDPYGPRETGIDYSNTSIDEAIVELLTIQNLFVSTLLVLFLLVGIVIVKRKSHHRIRKQTTPISASSTSNDENSKISVVNNYHYGDNIDTQITDSVVQRSFNHNHETKAESVSLDNSAVKTDVNEYIDAFFDVAKEMGYEIETCMRGSAKGKKQIDFGNKKLHEEHIRDLFPLVQNKGYEFTTKEFDSIVSGRPCAMKGFREINKRLLKQKFLK